jgi:hypothetical protein
VPWHQRWSSAEAFVAHSVKHDNKTETVHRDMLVLFLRVLRLMFLLGSPHVEPVSCMLCLPSYWRHIERRCSSFLKSGTTELPSLTFFRVVPDR